MVTKVCDQLMAFANAVVARTKSWLPFGGAYLQKLVDELDGVCGKIIDQLRGVTEENYNAEVEAIINYLKGVVPVPIYLFWVRPMVNALLDQLAAYLIAHKDLILGKLVAVPAPAHQ